MKIVMINGLLFCLVFMWVSAAMQPGPGSDVYENGSRDGIQPRRKKKCRNLGGWCIKTKRECPEWLPLETKPGRPYCAKKHRCCYPVDTECKRSQSCKKADGVCKKKCNEDDRTIDNGCTGNKCNGKCCASSTCKKSDKCKTKGGLCKVKCNEDENSLANGCTGRDCQKKCCFSNCKKSDECSAIEGICRKSCSTGEKKSQEKCLGKNCKCCVSDCKKSDKCKEKGGKCKYKCDKEEKSLANGCQGKDCQKICCYSKSYCETSDVCKATNGTCRKKCMESEDMNREKCPGKDCQCCAEKTCKVTAKCTDAGGYCVATEDQCSGDIIPGCKSKYQKCHCCKETVKCGTETPNEDLHRVINGKEVEPNRKYSWVVALYANYPEKDDFFCGGSIINDLYILTAAHCFFDDKCNLVIPEKVYVGIGSNDVRNPTTLREATFDNIIINDKYNCWTLDNDAALIEIKSIADLFINGKISPICLAKNDLNKYEGVNATVSGWGSTIGYNPSPPTPEPDYPTMLMEAAIPVISNDVCINDVSDLTENMLCGSTGKGFLKNGTDSCKGDSGGPLIFKEENASQNEQIGIVSYGYGCASEGNHGVYTRVTKLIEWITKHAEKIYTISSSTTK